MVTTLDYIGLVSGLGLARWSSVKTGLDPVFTDDEEIVSQRPDSEDSGERSSAVRLYVDRRIEGASRHSLWPPVGEEGENCHRQVYCIPLEQIIRAG